MGNNTTKVKKLLLILSVLQILPNCAIFSQEFPFPADGAQWNNSEMYLEDISNSQSVERIEIKGGDTLINGVTYAKLYRTWSASYYQMGDCEFKYNSGPSRTNTYVGAIRINNNQRVFIIVPEDTIIRTLYDFSLSIGDTLYIKGMNYQYTAEVVSVDSINVNGKFRKRLSIQGYMYDTWIEGIGSIYGLFAPINRHWEKYDYALICYIENGFPLYQEWPDSECYRCNLVSSILNSQINPRISVIPNPIVDRSQIEYPAHLEPKYVNIYGLQGRLLYSISLSSNRKVFIEKHLLETGVFLLELVSKNEHSYFQKIIVL